MNRFSEKVYYTNEVLKLCNLSRKQLLYYEKKGLISDVPRNRENNYRYYTQTHITQLFIVKEYLSVGYRLDEIYELLYESDVSSITRSANQRLQKAREDYFSSILQYEHNVTRHAQIMEGLSYLKMQAYITHKDSQSIRCEIRKCPRMKVASEEGTGTPFDLLSWSQASLSPLYLKMEQYNLKSTGPLVFTFHDLVEKDAFCLIPGEKKTTRSFPAMDIFNNYKFLQEMGGMQCASAIHVGNYNETLQETYDILLQWCREQQLRLTGDSIEQYLIGSEMTSNANLHVTRIMLPLETV